MIFFSPKKWLAVAMTFTQAYIVAAQSNQSALLKQVITYKHLKNINTEPGWHLTDSIALNFETYHTQGLVKVGNFYYLSSVKVNRWPKKYDNPIDGFDRDKGEGIGYLFKFGMDGKLIDSIRVGNNEIYHPGGIDFDGKYIWVPVCEYRPFGKSIIYRVNPESLTVQTVTTIADAIGGVAYNRENNELIGMNWGSRKFYRWKINQSTNNINAVLQQKEGNINPHFYVDLQDCNYVGEGKMFCSGLRSYKNAKGETVRLGGLELINMKTFEATLQIPVSEYTTKGVILTNNPFYIGIENDDLKYYFIPEDDNSILYIYRLESVK